VAGFSLAGAGAALADFAGAAPLACAAEVAVPSTLLVAAVAIIVIAKMQCIEPGIWEPF
jgi:hypothetical protein